MSNLILLTGASGFIGSVFLKKALARGWSIRVLTRNPQTCPNLAGIEVVQGNLLDNLDWERVLDGVQVIVHTAAEINNPALVSLVNFQGSANLLKAAVTAGVKRWIQLSSVGAYGQVHDGVVTEDYPDNPLGPYEVSKTDFDQLLFNISSKHSIEFCIVRPSIVYGPGMRNQSLYHMLVAMRKGVFAFIGPPGASANYVYVDDVVNALELCVEKANAANQTYIVSSWSTIEDMAGGIAAGAGLKLPNLRINLRLAKQLACVSKWWPRWPLTLSRVYAMSSRVRYSTRKIENELGWKMTVPVRDGMLIYTRSVVK